MCNSQTHQNIIQARVNGMCLYIINYKKLILVHLIHMMMHWR